MRSITRPGLSMASIHRPFSSAADAAIRVTHKNKLLTVELNRPKALNALSLEMCTTMKTLLRDKINAPNSDVGAYIMKGVGGKAFCAGGDVKAIWQELQNAHTTNSPPPSLTVSDIGIGKPGYLHTDFFRQEYIMNYLIGTSLKPQVSFWDGIIMGGGVGISVLGEFRVATEKSLFAMPETAIGLFPDVGSSAWLPHLPAGCGEFIGRLPMLPFPRYTTLRPHLYCALQQPTPYTLYTTPLICTPSSYTIYHTHCTLYTIHVISYSILHTLVSG
ncbi:hypothetical protein EON63_05720 [archaeon]|nr:MAG: hypothetical protein EON63_05720 [archaeon]